MARVLVCYGTGEGQTATVAARIADVFEERGHEATAIDLEDRAGDVAVGDFDVGDLPVDDYDAVLVGASIHVVKHQPEVLAFVEANRERLAARPTAFFQVSLSSATEEGRAQAAGYVDDFVERTGWHPDRIGLFGGALRFSEYGFLTRFVIKRIAKANFPEVDPSTDVEFTDWAEVEAFANDVAAFVEGRLGEMAPVAEP